MGADTSKCCCKKPDADGLNAETAPPGAETAPQFLDANTVISHGPLIGEVTHEAATIWARGTGVGSTTVMLMLPGATIPFAEQAMTFESTADYTSKVRFTNLSPQSVYDVQVGGQAGTFRTPEAPYASKSGGAMSFVFGCCLGGQGYGPVEGIGFSIFESMLALAPHFLFFNGDSIYADDKIEKVSTNPWNKGLRCVGEGDQLAATDLAGFRARYRYHLDDPAYARFLANTPVFNTWDDHEIADDWGAQKLRENGQEDVLRNGMQAFFEYWPLSGPAEEPNRVYRAAAWGPHCELFILDCRSYRDTHQRKGGGTPKLSTMLGKTQFEWLLKGLTKSSSTWKFICTSVPLCFPTGWPHPAETGYDGWADGDSQRQSGPELELLKILDHIRENNVSNVIFLSGDVHFPFAISYDPFHSGEPLFHEFGCTPFSALCLPPPITGADDSFNPSILFAEGKFAGDNMNFGHIRIDDDGRLTFKICKTKGEPMFTLDLEPRRRGSTIWSPPAPVWGAAEGSDLTKSKSALDFEASLS